MCVWPEETQRYVDHEMLHSAGKTTSRSSYPVEASKMKDAPFAEFTPSRI